MRATVTRLTLATCVAAAVACGQRKSDDSTRAAPTPGETAGTAGTEDQLITISGCVTKAQPDGYILTSSDDALVNPRGTSGHHRSDPDTRPTDANRGAENERARHEQNPSAEFGRYRLEGDQARIAMYANREVEIHGRVEQGDNKNRTPATVHVESIDATGLGCGANR